MSLTPHQITELRESWNVLSRDPEALTAGFYARLFDIAPEVRPLFAGIDMDAQGSKLAVAVNLVVRHAANLAPVLPALADLGRRHAGYGVTEAHYDAVGQALIHAIGARLGDGFTPDCRAAWATAYAAVAATMQAGAELKKTA